ncbi:MAG TPA: MogA/MoaB family molybdenum cofactor biosynthesis protein [Solirubrobacteraceae bacterium]|nr:MogA/MoaB family molybdenum cofactor biosynthesis protein [Solirubrobacteraceae bacterium]
MASRAHTARSLTAAILTISDTRSAGTRADTTTALMAEILEGIDIEIVATRLVPDEQEQIAATIVELCDGANLVLTSGGTGLAPRDVTPEATRSVIDREAPGIAEAMRAGTAQFQRLAWLSRAVAGTRGRTLVINLPGNPKAVRECLGVLTPMLPHALKLASGDDSDGGGGHGAAAKP